MSRRTRSVGGKPAEEAWPPAAEADDEAPAETQGEAGAGPDAGGERSSQRDAAADGEADPEEGAAPKRRASARGAGSASKKARR
jgi:hypothetical protein